MEHFSVGDPVIIRYGKQQGLRGTIIRNLAADVFRVKLEDGSVMFFCGKGLEKSSGRAPQPS